MLRTAVLSLFQEIQVPSLLSTHISKVFSATVTAIYFFSESNVSRTLVSGEADGVRCECTGYCYTFIATIWTDARDL